LLHWAAFCGYKRIVQRLLEKGTDIAVKNRSGQTALSRAAMKGHEKGADVESKEGFYNQTPLSYAAQHGHEAVVKLLLEKGADVECRSNGSATPLFWAVETGREAVVKLLLEKGANMESTEGFYGQTPLSLAARGAQKWHEGVMKLLLEKGADMESKSHDGQTPLSWAARSGHVAAVKMLLEKGADVESKDDDGQTPLLRTRNEAVVKLLLEKGAKKLPGWKRLRRHR
jgi:ankyrin repeat protein